MAEQKWITTSYGTRINVTGLSPEQIAKVKSVAQDNGAYGAKGAALAKELQKKAAATKAATTTAATAATAAQAQQPVPGGATADAVAVTNPTTTPDLGVKPDGTIDATKATPAITGAEERDAQKTFNMNNPGEQVDALGNKQTIEIDPQTGLVKKAQASGQLGTAAQGFLQGAIGNAATKGNLDLSAERGILGGAKLDLSGGPGILETNDVRSEADKVAQANYGFLTRNLQRDKARELEDVKQELANRGIPIDYENPNSMWNKAVGSVNERYDQLDQQANQQALMTRDSSLGTLVGAQRTARDAFVDSASRTFDATTGLAKDTAALKGMESGQALSTLGAAGNTLGQTTGQFTNYAGGQIDQSSILAGLLGQMSQAELAKYGIDKDFIIKKQALNKPTGGGGGGGGSGDGFGIVIGGTAP